MKPKLTNEVSVSEMRALRDMGFTLREIAAQLNVSVPTVCKYLKGYRKGEGLKRQTQ